MIKLLFSIFLLFFSLAADDIECISKRVSEDFLKLYPHAKLEGITITQRGTRKFEFPSKYDIVLKSKSLNKEKGILYITPDGKRKYYFNFKIDAKIPVIKSTEIIPRKAQINKLNTNKVLTKFDRHSARAINSLPTTPIMAKKNIAQNRYVDRRDITLAPIVKEGSAVNIILHDGSLYIQFSATATRDASLNEVITFIKTDGKRLKAKVIGPSKALML